MVRSAFYIFRQENCQKSNKAKAFVVCGQQVSSTTGSGSMILATSSHSLQTMSGSTRGIDTISTVGGQNNPSTNNSAPLVLSLSQIQGGGGLLILNSSSSGPNGGTQGGQLAPVSVASFVCNQNNSLVRTNNMKQEGTKGLVSIYFHNYQ